MLSPASTDHFIPKSSQPSLAYEWSNFRLAAPRLNSTKHNSVGIIDPFNVQSGWFALDFPSCLVKPGHGISDEIASQVGHSIRTLRLNDEYLVEERASIMLSVALGEITIPFIVNRYPFLAFEIARQNIAGRLQQIFKIRQK